MVDETENLKSKILASANMTNDQVEMSLVKSLLEQNEELSSAVDGKNVRIVTQWQIQKGSDPDSLVHIHFIEAEPDAKDIPEQEA